MSQHSIDLTVFVIVVALRLIVPLFIPRYPLPAIVASMIIDAADQTIFQNFTKLNLDGYQSYDKALDIYYLAVAYLSTMRNWANLTAFRVSRFLFFYRMIGVLLFEFFHIRALLLIFPNTFEYFFDFYEGVRLRWNPARMSKQLVIGAAAFIWIVIKLPQEYWIHVAQLDTTDLAHDHPIPALIVTVGGAIALVAIVRNVWPKLPPKEWDMHFDVDKRPDITRAQARATSVTSAEKFWDNALLEKVALVAIIVIVFGRILPGVRASDLQLALACAVLIIANTVISEWFARRGTEWESAIKQFLTMAVINTGLVIVARWLLPSTNGRIGFNSLFFVGLITMIIVLYDRYHPRYLARIASGEFTS